MARPETLKDIKEEDRMIQVGTMDLERFILMPKLLKHYTALVEEIQREGGTVETSYGTNVVFKLPRDQKQMEQQLRTDQYRWDDMQKKFQQAVKDDPDNPVQEYYRDQVKEWAEAEGLPNPFDPFAANDPELQRIRTELGFDN